MQTRNTYIAWTLVALAVCAWIGVILFARTIAAQEAEQAQAIISAQQSSTVQSASVRLHAIAQDTAGERTQLDQLLAVDVVSAANLLKGLGKATGVTVRLSGALPEVAPASTPNGPQIQAVGFAVQADGSFAALMRTLQIIEHLPLASSVERFDIQRAQDSKGPVLWHMNVYIRVLTSSLISS